MYTPETGAFVLPAELNIYRITETRDALLAWVNEHNTHGREVLEISAREVQEVDGSGLQLLAALSNLEQPWRLVEPSERFADACRAMGLGQWVEGRQAKNAGGAA